MSCEEQQKRVVVYLTREQDALWRELAAHTNEIVISKHGRLVFGRDCTEFAGCGQHANNISKKIWHTRGLISGKQWMELPVVEFDHVRITKNTKYIFQSHVTLHPMHKYVPILSIYEAPSNLQAPSNILKLVAFARFDYTEFIAVKKSQNRALCEMKPAPNSYDEGHRKGKRRHSFSLSPSPPKQTRYDVPMMYYPPYPSFPLPHPDMMPFAPPCYPHFGFYPENAPYFPYFGADPYFFPPFFDFSMRF